MQRKILNFIRQITLGHKNPSRKFSSWAPIHREIVRSVPEVRPISMTENLFRFEIFQYDIHPCNFKAGATYSSNIFSYRNSLISKSRHL